MTRKQLLENLMLLSTTLLVCLLVFEFLIFKYILKTSDVIPNTSMNNVIRYLPNTKATLYEPDGTSHTVNINENGWNSPYKAYQKQKPENTTRIAVIGDSYVQASAVNVNEGFAQVIEQQLNAKGYKTQVYRFGIDGAPLSQYLHILTQEALQYKPDIVVVQLIHNDFDESYRFLYGRYSSSFMKLDLEGDKIKQVAPEPYNPGWVDTLKNSRTFRYLYYQTGLAVLVRRMINKEEETQAKPPKHGFVQSAIDVRNITELDKIETATAYVFDQFKTLSQTHNFKLLITMDPVREAIYADNDAKDYEANALNTIAQNTAKEKGIPFLDLKTAMSKAYKADKKKFEFPWDWHWNKHGNDIAGKAIAKDLELQFLQNPTNSQ